MPGCGNTHTSQKVGLHRLGDPNNDRFRRWVRFLHLIRKDRQDYSPRSTICSEHFSVQDVLNYELVMTGKCAGYVLQ